MNAVPEVMQKERDFYSSKLKIGSEALYLSKQELQSLDLSIPEVQQLIEQLLTMHGNKRVQMPPKTEVNPLGDDSSANHHAMPCWLPDVPVVGMKWISGYPDNVPKYGLTFNAASIILNDFYTGMPICFMDGVWPTVLRTPAVSAISAKYLHPYAKTCGIIGCGAQGYAHTQHLSAILADLEEIYLYDVNEDNVARLIQEIQPNVQPRLIKAKNPEQVTKSSELIVTAAPSGKSVRKDVREEWIQAGQTFLPIELYSTLDPKISFRADKCFTDSISQTLHFQDMGFCPDGLPEFTAEIGDVVAGHVCGRDNKEQIVISMNLGMGSEDMIVAHELFHRALERNVGRMVPV